MVEKSPRPKARPQTPKESKPSAPEKSLRPKTREQVRVEDEMRQFGNLEFRADMEDQLSWNPLARLGFEPDQSVVGRPAYNSPRIYEGIRYPYDSEQEYIDETLPRAASGAEYRDIVGRVKPGSVIVNSNTAKNPVWSHEYTHGGLEKVVEYLDEDRDFFTAKYGEDTVRLLDEIRSDTNRSKGPNEKLTEMLDDVSKDLKVDLEGNLIPAAGTALGKMDNTRTAVEDWAASPTSRSIRSRRTLQEYLKLGRVKDEKLHKSDIESAFPGYVGIFEAAEDMLEAQGKPLPTEKRGWLKRTLSKMGFDEGGLATQTEEALGWTAEGKKFADANPVEVKENQQSTALSIADVPVFDRPMDASESDKWTGVQDELGNRQYVTIFGRTYFVRPAEDQRSNYEKIQQDIIPAVKNYLDNPTAPSREQTIDFLKQSLGAAWETFKIPGDLAAGNKGMEDVTLGNIFELAGGTGAASTVGKVPGGDSSNTLRTFGGSNPPTYNPRKNLLSSQREVDEFFDSVVAPQEYLDLRNTEFVLFREPISEFAETVSIPKKGLLGSEFLNLIKKNDSIPETSLQEGIIDPQKRYSRDELLYTINGAGGFFQSVANIATNKPKSYENYQRQIRDAGFIGGMETEYFDIPISSRIGYPGKNFMPISTHYGEDTIVHVRGSIVDPSQSDLSISTLNVPDQNFAAAVDNENYLLVEEIQSDLLTKGYLRPKNSFDQNFKKAADSYSYYSGVDYQEAFGTINTEIRSIVKELEEEGIEFPGRTVPNYDLNKERFYSAVNERGYSTFEELSEYFIQQKISSLDVIYSDIFNLLNKGFSIVGKSDTFTPAAISRNGDKIVELFDEFRDYHGNPVKSYTKQVEEFKKIVDGKLKNKKIDKEIDSREFTVLYSDYFAESSRNKQETSRYGLPPIRKNKQAVDEALKILIAKAAQSDVNFIVIPPAERIALARGRDLKKDKGDRFYRTYVTDLEKSLSELEANYPVKVFNAELPYKRHEKFVGFVPDMGDSINTGTSNTGTIIDISELVDKYRVEEPRQFAQGGVVNDMNRQMNLFSRGGLGDDGMQRDPVSGNEIPPGSLAEEVRDDIPAQLSEGEYVVPADVVRFFGVKYFEDLRAEAKMGLQSMEAGGRIGGEPVGMPMAQASNPNEITEEDLAQLEQMLSTGVANGGLMDKIAIAAKTDKVINDRMNANGMVVGYATGGEVTAPTASYADPTRVDAVINKVMVTLQQKPELVQELSKRGIQISRTNPSMQAGQMNQANPPAETRKAFAIGGMPMDTSYMTPTGLPSWASVPGSSYTYQGPGVPDATGQIPGTATPDTTPAAATNAADACKAMGMGYDPATGTCILVDSGDSGPITAPEPAEFKWEEPDVNYFEMSEEELAAIGTGAKIDPFMNKLALGAAAVAGPLGLLIGGYNIYQQSKAISEIRSAALVAKARGFDDLAETLSKQADDLVGKSSFLIQGADKFGGLSGVNDFAQQFKFFAPKGMEIDQSTLGLTEDQQVRVLQAASPPGMVYQPETQTYVSDEKDDSPPGGGGTFVETSSSGTPIYTPTSTTVRPVSRDNSPPKTVVKDNSPPKTVVKSSPTAGYDSKKDTDVASSSTSTYGSGSQNSYGVGTYNPTTGSGGFNKGGLMKKRKKK